MSRVTPTEVKAVLPTSLSDAVVQIWIDAASQIVDDKAECIGADDADRLTQVELYLSAHMIALLPGEVGTNVKSRKFDVMQTDYAVVEATKQINTTAYGQTANALAQGCLSDINDRKISFDTVGGDY